MNETQQQTTEKRFASDPPQDAGEMPFVSVICMAYQQDRYIELCLNAILSQEVTFPVEVIVHDDASTDKTGEIAKQYERNYPGTVRVIVQSENLYQRHQKVRPAVLPKARGKYVAYCDADDLWRDPRKLSKQVNFLEANPEFVICYHAFERIDADGEVIRRKQRPKRQRDLSPFQLSRLEAEVQNATLLHRNVPIDFPPEFGLAPNGDAFLPLLLSRYGAAKYLDEVVPSGYRQHRQSSWSSQPKDIKKSRHLQGYYQIAAYLLRVGLIEEARHVIKYKVGPAERRLNRVDARSDRIATRLKEIYFDWSSAGKP